MVKLNKTAIVMLSIIFLTPISYGEEMPVMQNLTESLELVNTLKEQELPADLTTLQTALNRIIDLWNAQNETMMSDINIIEKLVPEEYTTRIETYRKALTEIRLWNDDIRTKINQKITIAEAITLASALRARQQARESALNEIIDFNSIFLNQNAIAKAHTRITAIIKDEKKIKSTLTANKWTIMNQLIKQTQMLIKNANQFNKKAMELLAPEEALHEENKGLTIEGVITKSENSIKATYTNFLAMSKLIKK